MDHRIHQMQPQALNFPGTKRPTEKVQQQASFKDILASEQHVKISKHAKERMDSRNIQINDKQWQAINERMLEAKGKGVTDSLVVTSSAALLVSTKNNTVVTAMNRDEATSRIFTNINGTILIDE